eukprot:TRINITY_DN28447_c0_g1_i2.p1 TRINITY_DN28447_c0_g1~~TRINITY_DN28447_c0_g1_i2.p1  ORF type:complete len:221 (+),score=33.14 TRINITY_DN28447_c0_g1_i2:91-753(+)
MNSISPASSPSSIKPSRTLTVAHFKDNDAWPDTTSHHHHDHDDRSRNGSGSILIDDERSSTSTSIITANTNTNKNKDDDDCANISSSTYSRSHVINARNMILLIIVQLILSFAVMLLPLAPPIVGIKNNLVYILALIPVLFVVALSPFIIIMKLLLNVKRPHIITLFAWQIIIVVALFLIAAEFSSQFPLPVVNTGLISIAAGGGLIIPLYFISPLRFTR